MILFPFLYSSNLFCRGNPATGQQVSSTGKGVILDVIQESFEPISSSGKLFFGHTFGHTARQSSDGTLCLLPHSVSLQQRFVQYFLYFSLVFYWMSLERCQKVPGAGKYSFSYLWLLFLSTDELFYNLWSVGLISQFLRFHVSYPKIINSIIILIFYNLSLLYLRVIYLYVNEKRSWFTIVYRRALEGFTLTIF